MAENQRDEIREPPAREPSAREAGELLKDRLSYIKSRNLVDAVKEQRQREKQSRKWGRKQS